MRKGMRVPVSGMCKRWTCAVVVGVLLTQTGSKNNGWNMTGTMTYFSILHQREIQSVCELARSWRDADCDPSVPGRMKKLHAPLTSETES